MTDQTETPAPSKREQFLTLTAELQLTEKQAAADANAYLGGPDAAPFLEALAAFQNNMLPTSTCDRAIATITRAIEVARTTFTHPSNLLPAPVTPPMTAPE